MPVTQADNDEVSEPSPIKRGFWRALFLVAGLGLGMAIPYVWYLDKQVRTQFSELKWQVPTKVYARPLVLKPGIALDGAGFELELQAGGYSNDGQGRVAGSYGRLRRRERRALA